MGWSIFLSEATSCVTNTNVSTIPSFNSFDPALDRICASRSDSKDSRNAKENDHDGNIVTIFAVKLDHNLVAGAADERNNLPACKTERGISFTAHFEDHLAMIGSFISRGFRGRGRSAATAGRLPPGQSVTSDFPVLSAGPTPRVSLATWDFAVHGPGGDTARWTWAEFQALPHETVKTDIHCVTKWSKLGTVWEGISVDTLLGEAAARGVESAPYLLAECEAGYTTNVPLADVMGGKAWVAFGYDGAPLPPEHGGPARLLVPHLYFWKSAKWLRGLRLMEREQLGFWEVRGYHAYGDPWREQRYTGDP